MTEQELNHLGNSLIFMTRYSLPRNTSSDMATTSALRVFWSQLKEVHRKRIVETIESEKDLYGYDAWLWNDFLEWVKAIEVI